MEKVKEPKANWDSAAHTIFMNACVEEVRANNRNGVIVMKAKLPLFKIEPRVGRRGRVLIRQVQR